MDRPKETASGASTPEEASGRDRPGGVGRREALKLLGMAAVAAAPLPLVRGGMDGLLALAGVTLASSASTPGAGIDQAATAPAAMRTLAAPTGVSITLDGKMGDWGGVPGLQVPLSAIPTDFRDDPWAAGDFTATLKVATDATNIYVLVAVPDGYSYVADDHRLSPAIGVEWQIGAAATPQMAGAGADLSTSSGMVDIWHWELDCGPGLLSGGSFPTGNDPACNLDDEYATLTDDREDDDTDNSLTGSWDHTARAAGIDAVGTFVFEMARPLQTGDAQDAQFALGGVGRVAIAYWDGNEGAEDKGGGWSDAGHAVSITADEGIDGWIEVAFASTAAAVVAPAPPSTGDVGLASRSGTSAWVGLGLAAMALTMAAASRVATGRGQRS